MAKVRIRIVPRRQYGEIRRWVWQCSCGVQGGTRTTLAWYNPDAKLSPRDRCFRNAYWHLKRIHA